MRIVSLLPGATEIVFALGLGDDLVAVSHECDFPHAAKSLPAVTRSLIPAGASSGEIDRVVRERVGSRSPLYALDVDALEALRPDVIITQALCDVCAVSEEDVHAVARRLTVRPDVINLETRSFIGLLDGIRQVAGRTGRERAGEELIGALRQRATQVEIRSTARTRDTRVVFLEWLDPLFAGGHWNPELIRMAGGSDPFGQRGMPARTVLWADIEAFQPEVVFVACCGFTVDRTLEDLPALTGMPGWSDLPAVRQGRVYIADGAQYFSRPGPRLVDSLEMLAHAIDPGLHELPAGVPAARRVRQQDPGTYHVPESPTTQTC